MASLDLTGFRFGRLVAIKAVGKNRSGNTMWLCKCDCGNETTTCISNLRNGHTKSCGCYSEELKRGRKTRLKHGMSYTRIYYIWQGMKQRCNGQQEKENYYDRGIRLCPEWNDFEVFYEWALNNGYSEKLTIDRINVNGNYEPTNCRWITQKEQNRNKTTSTYLSVNGETKTMGEWHELLGIPFSTMVNRRKRGCSDAEILSLERLKRGTK